MDHKALLRESFVGGEGGMGDEGEDGVGGEDCIENQVVWCDDGGVDEGVMEDLLGGNEDQVDVF